MRGASLYILTSLLLITPFRSFGKGQELLENISVSGFTLGHVTASQIAMLVAKGYSQRDFKREGSIEWTHSPPTSRIGIQFDSIGEIQGDFLGINGSIVAQLAQPASTAQQKLSKYLPVYAYADHTLYASGKVGEDGFELWVTIKDGRILRILLKSQP